MAKRVPAILDNNVHDYDTEQQYAANRKSNSLKMKLDHMERIEPLTDNQKLFFKYYDRGDYFMGLMGSAGTGKTLISIYKALSEVMSKDNPYNKLVIIRSNVATRDIGHLPGSLEEKMEIYEMPYQQICKSIFNRNDAYQRLKEQDYIEFLSSSFVRGTTFQNAIIIVDEVANMTLHELSTVIGRTGTHSKLILVGDVFQNDLIKKSTDTSGLREFQNIAAGMREYTEIKFTPDDIVRSSLTKSWIMAYEKYLTTNT